MIVFSLFLKGSIMDFNSSSDPEMKSNSAIFGSFESMPSSSFLECDESSSRIGFDSAAVMSAVSIRRSNLLMRFGNRMRHSSPKGGFAPSWVKSLMFTLSVSVPGILVMIYFHSPNVYVLMIYTATYWN